jgi:hypothetical protein
MSDAESPSTGNDRDVSFSHLRWSAVKKVVTRS